MPANINTSSIASPPTQIYGPPLYSPMANDALGKWIIEVAWPIIGKGLDNSGPQGTFPQLQVGRATFSSENAFQDLINLDQGIYVSYFSSIDNIIYGFACNVHHSKSAQFTVGAQINAWGEAGSTGDVFGIACTALGQPLSGTRNLIAFEPDIGNLCSTSTGAKWGMNPVFKDRMDGATLPGEGVIGSNLYNYFAEGLVFTSQPRTASGEFCGWNCGIDFLDASLDISSVQAWSAVVFYGSGMIVSSGGLLWKAILANINNLPAGGSTFWVQHTYAGTTNLAVGIDFSSMSVTSMSRMASAVRLRTEMYMHWEETGAIGTCFLPSGIFHVCDNQGNLRLGVDVGTGLIYTSIGTIALGGGAAATLGTIGGTGPTVAAQNSWGRINYAGATYFIPLWQ